MTFIAARATRPFHVRRALVAVLLVGGLATSARAQQLGEPNARGSRFIATTDWMTETVTQLRSRGYLTSLNPITRPWTRDEVARAIAPITAASRDTLPYQVAQWFRLLRSELGPELNRIAGRDSLSLGFQAWGGATAATSPRIDPLFPLRKGFTGLNHKGRDPASAFPFGGAGGWGERGPFAVELRLGWDLALRRADPDGTYPGRLFDVLPDNEVSYGSAQFTNAAFVVGRLRRDWAPVGQKGLMLSDNAIGIPQIGYAVGGKNVMLRGFVGELDTLRGFERYLVAHRVEYVTDDFAIAIGESKVYGSTGGPRIPNFNPVEIFFLTGDKAPGEAPTNTSLDGQIWYHWRDWSFGGETFVDDVWISQHAPARVAASAAINYFPRRAWYDFGVNYSVVTSYTYWTRNSGDIMMFFGRGLGSNFSDYDLWSGHTDLFPRVPGLRLTPTISRLRKGEWDFRLPTISDSAWKASPTLFQGVTEKITRFALAGRYQPTRRVFAEWDAGYNVVTNANHILTRGLNEFSAVLKVGVNWSAPDRLVP